MTIHPSEQFSDKVGTAVAVLIDFDNFYGGKLREADNAWLAYEINKMISEALKLIGEIHIINIRFYGGWLQKGVLTRLGSLLQQSIQLANPFPLSHVGLQGILRGEISLATRLLQLPAIEWPDTYRSKAGPPKLRLANDNSMPDGCARTDSCPVILLRQFTNKKGKPCHIETCTVTNCNAFLVAEQKMVDTMLACDILAFAQDTQVAGIVVLSDDSDLLPPLAMATAMSKKPLLLANSGRHGKSPYKGTLEALGISVKTWEES